MWDLWMWYCFWDYLVLYGRHEGISKISFRSLIIILSGVTQLSEPFKRETGALSEVREILLLVLKKAVAMLWEGPWEGHMAGTAETSGCWDRPRADIQKENRDLSPTIARNWIQLQPCELRRDPWTLDGIAALAEALISAWWDLAQGTWLKLKNDKWVSL